MRNYARLRPEVFDAHAEAPPSWHEFLQAEEARERRQGNPAAYEAHNDAVLPAHPYSRPMKQNRLTGEWFPE